MLQQLLTLNSVLYETAHLSIVGIHLQVVNLYILEHVIATRFASDGLDALEDALMDLLLFFVV